MERQVDLVGPPECPDHFAACLTPIAGLALARNLEALRRYNRHAYLRCSTVPTVDSPSALPRSESPADSSSGGVPGAGGLERPND